MNILLKLFYQTIFTVAYRKRGDEDDCLLEEGNKTFCFLPATKDIWYADPFLFIKDNRVFVFCEVYNGKREKGEIGFFELSEDNSVKIEVILTTDYHLSYPFVFEINNVVYMIPETNEAQNIQLFKAKKFPYEWEQVAVIKDNIHAVDSTLVVEDDIIWLFTSILDNDRQSLKSDLNIFYNENKDLNGKFKSHAQNPVCSEISSSRMAGRIFSYKDKLIRPSQDCSGYDYGRGLAFNEIKELSEELYSETVFKRIYGSDIKLENLKQQILGVHTYALDSNWEVIDIKYRVLSIISIRNLFRAVINRISKMFLYVRSKIR